MSLDRALVERVARIMEVVPDRMLAAELVIDAVAAFALARTREGARTRQAKVRHERTKSVTVTGSHVTGVTVTPVGPAEPLTCARAPDPDQIPESDPDQKPPTPLEGGVLVSPERRAKPRKPRGYEWPEELRTWYAAFPKKVDPEDTAKAWHQTTDKRPPLAVMLATLEWQTAEWAKGDWKYIKHPAAYLRAGKWADQRPPIRGSPLAVILPPEESAARMQAEIDRKREIRRQEREDEEERQRRDRALRQEIAEAQRQVREGAQQR